MYDWIFHSKRHYNASGNEYYTYIGRLVPLKGPGLECHTKESN